ncbi:MAG: cysteine peptidase family C39 domain-containing protein, partial [Clostridium sp.]|uniref:cysteine peptidase family C39 domain-containing protein n=1 Tax=Clostridium sp. TaxID=1506 RepID=UPI003F40F3EC
MKKIKMVMQMKQTECGLCVAQMILNYYGVMVSLSELNHKLEVGRDGISLKRMKVMLEEYGMSTNLYRIT